MPNVIMEMMSEQTETKKCPFCAETIQKAAIKCRFCGEFLDKPRTAPKPRSGWWQSNGAIILGLATVGPFALPLVWFNPRLSLAVKTIITIVVLVATVLLTMALIKMINNLLEQIKSLGI